MEWRRSASGGAGSWPDGQRPAGKERRGAMRTDGVGAWAVEERYGSRRALNPGGSSSFARFFRVVWTQIIPLGDHAIPIPFILKPNIFKIEFDSTLFISFLQPNACLEWYILEHKRIRIYSISVMGQKWDVRRTREAFLLSSPFIVFFPWLAAYLPAASACSLVL